MHSVNKANFAILHWFGLRFEARFTNLEQQLSELYSVDDQTLYGSFVVRPVGRIDVKAIAGEKENIDRIVATLGLRDDPGHADPQAVHLHAVQPDLPGDPRIRQTGAQHLHAARPEAATHGAPLTEPRIESYHQLRAAIAQVGGKKELTSRTDLDIEISNQCGRLIANAIVYYNSAILSRLLQKFEASGNEKALALLKAVSPAAWRHVHLNGHYTFHGSGQAINLDAIIQGLNLE